MARPATGQVVETRRARDTMYALRFRAYGRRHYLTLGGASEGWNRKRAGQELANVLADVRRGIWAPPVAAPVVEAPKDEPTFHEIASEWVARRRHEVDQRTAEHWQWALSCHLLPYFKNHLPSQITVAAVEAYKTAKLHERETLTADLERWQKADPKERGKMPPKPLANGSVNKTLKVLAQVLDYACDLGYVTENAARGRKRRLKASKPRRTWLELHEVQALLNAAGGHRALLGTMILAGLRIGELCNLRWRDVDLANGRLRVEDAKTDAGERAVELSPSLLDDLKTHRADARFADPADYVFATIRGTARNRSNVTRQILAPTVAKANAQLVAAGRQPMERITNHSLRRTFASLLYEAGASPAYVMSQMGHTDPALALEIYTKVMERKRDTGVRMDALLRSADWAAMGSSSEVDTAALLSEQTKSPEFRGFSELRD